MTSTLECAAQLKIAGDVHTLLWFFCQNLTKSSEDRTRGCMIWTLPTSPDWSEPFFPLPLIVQTHCSPFCAVVVELDCEIPEHLQNEIQYQREIGDQLTAWPMGRAERGGAEGMNKDKLENIKFYNNHNHKSQCSGSTCAPVTPRSYP